MFDRLGKGSPSRDPFPRRYKAGSTGLEHRILIVAELVSPFFRLSEFIRVAFGYPCVELRQGSGLTAEQHVDHGEKAERSRAQAKQSACHHEKKAPFGRSRSSRR